MSVTSSPTQSRAAHSVTSPSSCITTSSVSSSPSPRRAPCSSGSGTAPARPARPTRRGRRCWSTRPARRRRGRSRTRCGDEPLAATAPARRGSGRGCSPAQATERGPADSAGAGHQVGRSGNPSSPWSSVLAASTWCSWISLRSKPSRRAGHVEAPDPRGALAHLGHALVPVLDQVAAPAGEGHARSARRRFSSCITSRPASWAAVMIRAATRSARRRGRRSGR